MAVEASVFDTDPAARLVQRGSGEQAAAYIRQLIFTGKLLPGTRLPQGEIAQALGSAAFRYGRPSSPSSGRAG